MIATTIEQSKRLLKLGLGVSTADMCLCKSTQCSWFLCAYVPSEYDAHTAPAWSLSALLEVMPKELLPELEWREGEEEWEANVWIDHNIHCISHYDKLCAAYEMVCWLLEQGLIKKGGQDESKD